MAYIAGASSSSSASESIGENKIVGQLDSIGNLMLKKIGVTEKSIKLLNDTISSMRKGTSEFRSFVLENMDDKEMILLVVIGGILCLVFCFCLVQLPQTYQLPIFPLMHIFLCMLSTQFSDHRK